ncbi:MAG: YHS domain-containing protein [Sedimentisphaerales bacterium]|nr:YHS domain-containing protein [Sedimentisphaerales bacterium]
MDLKKGCLLLAAFAIAALVTFGGCKKNEQPAAPAKTQTIEKTATKTATAVTEEAKKEATAVKEEAKKTATAVKEEAKKEATAVKEEAKKTAAAVEVEQTMCPVLEAKIDKNIFTEYKGKKVYFCCADCKAKFEAEPEKYIAKLPQFAK